MDSLLSKATAPSAGARDCPLQWPWGSNECNWGKIFGEGSLLCLPFHGSVEVCQTFEGWDCCKFDIQGVMALAGRLMTGATVSHQGFLSQALLYIP